MQDAPENTEKRKIVDSIDFIEASAVVKGAAHKADIVMLRGEDSILKRMLSEDRYPTTTGEIYRAERARAEMQDIRRALRSSVEHILAESEGEAQLDLLRKSIGEYGGLLEASLERLGGVVDDDTEELVRAFGEISDAVAPDSPAEGREVTIKRALGLVEDGPAEESEPDMERIEELQRALEAEQAKTAALEAKQAEAVEAVEIARAADAAEAVEGLGLKPEEATELMRALSETQREQVKQLVEAAKAQGSVELARSHGSDAGQPAAAPKATDELTELTLARAASEGVDFALAQAAILHERPDLFGATRRERARRFAKEGI